MCSYRHSHHYNLFSLRYLVLLSLLLLFASGTLLPQSNIAIYDRAMEAYEQNDYTTAHLLFSQLIEHNNIDTEIFSSAQLYSTEALKSIGEYEAALTGYEFFVTSFPYSNLRAEALYQLGILYYRFEEYANSRQRLQQYLREYPFYENYANAMYWVGETFIQQGRYQEARAILEEAAVKLQDNDFIEFTIYSLGHACEQLEDWEAAVEHYDELLTYYKESPLAAAARIRIGICYFHLDEYDLSILELSSPSVTSMPVEEQAEAQYLLANSYYRNAQFAQAAEKYRFILENYPGSPVEREVKYALAWSNFQLTRYNFAYDYFRELTNEADSIGIESYYWMGEAKRYAGEDNQAYEIYAAFLKKFPEHRHVPAIRYRLGILYFRNNQYADAVDMLLQATNAADPLIRAQAFTLLGEISLHRKKYEDALRYFETVSNAEGLPDKLRYRAMFGLGATSYQLNRFATAVEELNRLSGEASWFEHDKVSFYLAESFFELGEYDNARKLYEEIAPDNQELREEVEYGKGYCYYNTGDYRAASFQLQDFLDTYPQSPHRGEVSVVLANSYFADKKFKNAIDMYEDVLRNQRDVEDKDYVLYQYALALFQGGQSLHSVDRLQDLIERYPGSRYVEPAKYMTGWIYFKENNYGQAIAEYRRLISSAPDSKLVPAAYYAIGDAHFNQANYDSAIAYYNHILDEYPQSQYVYDAINGLQYSYFADGDTRRAIRVIDDFVKTNPGLDFSDRLYLKKGELYYGEAAYRKAQEAYEEFINMFPTSNLIPDAYYWRGKSAANDGKEDEAIDAFRTVFESFPQSDFAPSAVLEVTALYNDREQYQQSLDILNNATDRLIKSPRLPELLFQKAETYRIMDDIPNAYDTYNELIQYFREHLFADKARLQLGIIELDANRYDRAEEFFTELASRRTDDLGAQAQYYMGQTFYDQEEYQNAITAFVRVVNLFPGYEEWVAKSYLKLGECYEALDDKDKAIEMYRNALSRDKGGDVGREANRKMRRLR